MSKLNFTKRNLDQLSLPEPGKRICFFDENQRNLLIRVSHNGQKVFYVRRKVAGKSERIQIGRFPELSVEQARNKAATLLAEIVEGCHPKQAARAIKAEPTVDELFRRYIDGHARQHCVRVKLMEKDFERYLSDWKDKPYSQIKRSDVQQRVNKVLATRGPGATNHMIILMRAAINWNLRANENLSGENPWMGVKQPRIQARERFLTPIELARFFKALTECPDGEIHDYVLISLYTGARKSNVLAMRWDQIDFNLRIWRIPAKTFKNKESHVVPLTPSAVKLLLTRKTSVDSEWVFPSKVTDSHLVEPKKGWYKLLKAAEIEDLRLHDLRRTLGSYMAMGNQSLPVIAKALGHKTVAATQIYSRLMADPVRDAMEKAELDMLKSAGLLLNDHSICSSGERPHGA